MLFQLWTVQIARWRLVKAQEIYFLDVTAKSGEQAFAPEYRLVMAYKNGEMSEEDYTRAYLEKMAISQTLNVEKWKKLLLQPRVAVACYCKAGAFCHRHLFVDLMEGYLIANGQRVQVEGELMPGVLPRKEE